VGGDIKVAKERKIRNVISKVENYFNIIKANKLKNI